MKDDIVDFVMESFQTGKILKKCNSSFIILIPKIKNLVLVKVFRPISLIGLQYNILALELVKVVNGLVSIEQSTFVAERLILDSPLILSEIIS